MDHENLLELKSKRPKWNASNAINDSRIEKVYVEFWWESKLCIT